MTSFPTNPFPIVKPSDFDKNTKKKFSEDYVEENFRLNGWNVYEPFVDKGYDRVITKKVNGRNVIRFLQIKTRSLEKSVKTIVKNSQNEIQTYLDRQKPENHSTIKKTKDGKYSIECWKDYVGYTIKPRDLISDPRIVFVIFCDSEEVEDFLIFPIHRWIKFMEENNKSLFSTVGFKQGDGKFNDTFYHQKNKKWTWKWKNGVALDEFVNNDGLKLLESEEIDQNFSQIKLDIANFKKNNIFGLSYSKKFKDLDKNLQDTVKNINEFIKISSKTPNNLVSINSKNNQLIKNQSELILKSIKTYFSKQEKKILDI